MALCRGGWRVVYAPGAIAWTEVPATLSALWKQRYRWCFGTMQAMWKHRHAMLEHGRSGRFGRLCLPYLWLFQILLPLLAPLIDVFSVYGIVFLNPVQVGAFWLSFTALQMLIAGYALRLDGERLRALWVLPFQLIVYRQLMYLVTIQSVIAALARHAAALAGHQAHRRLHRPGHRGPARGNPVRRGGSWSSPCPEGAPRLLTCWNSYRVRLSASRRLHSSVRWQCRAFPVLAVRLFLSSRTGMVRPVGWL